MRLENVYLSTKITGNNKNTKYAFLGFGFRNKYKTHTICTLSIKNNAQVSSTLNKFSKWSIFLRHNGKVTLTPTNSN